jgi:hypothetical protein
MGGLLTDGIVFLQLIAMPLNLTTIMSGSESDQVWSKHWTLVIFCLMIVASSFIVSCAYWLPWSMIGVLLNPFAAGMDAYNTDALLASTERTLFVSMRALFDRKTPPDPKEFLYEGSSPAPLSQRSASASDGGSSSVRWRRGVSELQSIRRLGRIHTRLPVKVTAIERPVEPSLSARRHKSAVELRLHKTISGRSTSDLKRYSS